MHGAAIVPDYEVARLPPRHSANKLRLGREGHQIVDELAPFRERQSDDVGGVGGDVQRLAPRARMNLDQLVMRRGFCAFRRSIASTWRSS